MYPSKNTTPRGTSCGEFLSVRAGTRFYCRRGSYWKVKPRKTVSRGKRSRLLASAGEKRLQHGDKKKDMPGVSTVQLSGHPSRPPEVLCPQPRVSSPAKHARHHRRFLTKKCSAPERLIQTSREENGRMRDGTSQARPSSNIPVRRPQTRVWVRSEQLVCSH